MLRGSDLSPFSGREVDLVKPVIAQLANLNAAQVSELAHQFAGWQAADDGEEIPHETVFVAEPRPLSRE
jgi:hypothetical protein